MGTIKMPKSEDGAGMICMERNRQIVEKHWDDSRHDKGVLASKAIQVIEGDIGRDDWDIVKKHPCKIERLIIAGALIAAEIDLRLADRDQP